MRVTAFLLCQIIESRDDSGTELPSLINLIDGHVIESPEPFPVTFLVKVLDAPPMEARFQLIRLQDEYPIIDHPVRQDSPFTMTVWTKGTGFMLSAIEPDAYEARFVGGGEILARTPFTLIRESGPKN